MLARNEPNRAELLALALTWVGFAIIAVTGELVPLLLSLGVAIALTVTIVFGTIEPRARLEADASRNTRKLAAAASVSSESSLSAAADEAIAEIALSMRIIDDLRRLINALDQPVVVTDPAGTVLLTNRRAGELFGAGGVGRALEELCPFEGVLRIHSGAAGGRDTRGQVSISAGGLRRTFEVIAVPLSSDDPSARRSVVMTLTDITELANAAKAQTDFVANASHELRTPLASIRAAAETLEAAHDDPPMVEKLGAMIRSNAGRLEALLADMLELSRLAADEAPVTIEPIEIQALITEKREHFKTALNERNLDLVIERPGELMEIRTELRSIRLILRNLIENATKFAHEGTRITVRFSRPTNEYIRIEVIDRGIGIPIAAQARIFERFFQVDEARTGGTKRRGTGLGLAMVKEAVTRLGGEISVESVWQEGTTMRVELPYR